MEISDGKISLNILKMFNKNTRFIIESLIIKSKKENHAESSILPEDELEIKVSPINDSNYFLISFQKNQNIEKIKYKVIDINENMKERINTKEIKYNSDSHVFLGVCAPNDNHEVGLRIICDFLKSDG